MLLAVKYFFDIFSFHVKVIREWLKLWTEDKERDLAMISIKQFSKVIKECLKFFQTWTLNKR